MFIKNILTVGKEPSVKNQKNQRQKKNQSGFQQSQTKNQINLFINIFGYGVQRHIAKALTNVGGCDGLIFKTYETISKF